MLQVYSAPKPKWTTLKERRLQNWGKILEKKKKVLFLNCFFSLLLKRHLKISIYIYIYTIYSLSLHYTDRRDTNIKGNAKRTSTEMASIPDFKSAPKRVFSSTHTQSCPGQWVSQWTRDNGMYCVGKYLINISTCAIFVNFLVFGGFFFFF